MNTLSFWVPGRPVGVNKKYVGGGRRILTQAYRGFVERVHVYALAARRGWPPLSTIGRRSAGLFIVTYHNRLDVDAVVKPVCDALQGVFYENDSSLGWTAEEVRSVGERGEGVLIRVWHGQPHCPLSPTALSGLPVELSADLCA